MDAIQSFPLPTDSKQLQQFLGMINFYRKFLPNEAALLKPLYEAVKSTYKKTQLNCKVSGVPQGSILGPLLFLIYVNDMKAAVKCKLLLYADDSALLASSSDVSEIEEILKRELESVSEWLSENRLSLHLGKTESILFG